MRLSSASLFARVAPLVDENNNEIPQGETDGGDTTKTGVSQKSFRKGFFVMACVLAVSFGVQGASAAVALDATTAAKLAEIESLRRSSGLDSAEWTKRFNKDVQQEPEICYDQGCLDASTDLLNAANLSVDPCNNFFQFACGKWLVNNPVPPTSSHWGHLYRLMDGVNKITRAILVEEIDNGDAKPVNQVKEFYAECVNVAKLEAAGVAPLLRLIGEFGGWPLMDPASWNEADFDWIVSVGELRRRLLDDVIVSVHADRGVKNTSRLVVWLDQPSFGLPRGVLIEADSYPTLIAAYRTLIVELAQGLGSTETVADLNAAADAVINMEIELAKISLANEDRYQIENMYHPFKLNDFQTVTDAIDSTFSIGWKKLLDQVFSSSGVTINPDEQLNIAGLNYLLNAIPILKATPPKVIADYVGLRIATAVASSTTDAMRAILFKFTRALTGTPEPATQESSCAKSANNNFGMAIGVKYIEAAFDIEAKGRVDEMVVNLISAFREILDEATWMDDSTKSAAEAKVGTIRSFMAFPEWLENKTAVEEYYGGLELVTGTEAHFQSVLNLGLWSSDGILSKLRLPTTQDEWISIAYPGVVNAYYSAKHNSITFPAGILQPPYFGKLRPASQNYGGIGVAIGHEITHGFDKQGAQFDKDGNAINWWDPVTLEKFNEKAQCMVDQYDKFYFPNIDMYVNGEFTLGENIADNGGLRESFRAYRKYVAELGKEEGRLPGLENLTPNQLFFLGYGYMWCESITDEDLINEILTNTHSPAQFRILGPLMNSMDFNEAYACPDDSEMNPPVAEKCSVW